LHKNGIAHLDLKPDNLLLGRDFMFKICDFDLSYNQTNKFIESSRTKNFRAPELASGDCKDPYLSGIFSIGIILFFFMSGGHLHKRRTFPGKL